MDEARRLGIRGWVRNIPDGRVEAVFEGSKDAVEELVGWCRAGPPHARVAGVDVEWEDARDEFSEFAVRR